jgi:sugar-specific transcriptional regulator TrmB
MDSKELEEYLANVQSNLDALNQKLVDISNGESYTKALLQTETERLESIKNDIRNETGIDPNDKDALDSYYTNLKKEASDLIMDLNSINNLDEIIDKVNTLNQEDLGTYSVPTETMQSVEQLLDKYGIVVPEQGE